MENNFNSIKIFLENIKKDFNDLNFSLVFSVEYNNRMNAARTVAKLRAAFFSLSFPSRHPCFPFQRGRKSLFHTLETTVSYV